MATSISSQLQAIKSLVQVEADAAANKRPFTRPSIIFDPKEAADIDLETILSIALSGLEILIQNDIRFGNYKNNLFSHKSRDSDRELMSIEENNKINESIASFLRLLSGYLLLPASLKTLEYLVRRFKIHVYNTDELILCALPYHETHAFVRIVRLLNLGNSKWRFLEGVKVSGAPPPRGIIVQQCIRDMGVLETLCKYASPIKKYQPSVPVICFFTAVVVEMLGALPLIDDEVTRRILPYIFSGLEHTTKGGTSHKASALMIVGLLANKVALAPKLVKAMIEFIARVARQDAKESADLQWLRMFLMTIISLVETQSIQMFPKKALEIFSEIRDFTGVVLVLSKEFNAKRFLSVYLESLANYSSSDEICRLALISAIKTLPINDFIDNIVNKVLTSCMMLSKRVDSSELFESGSWAKQIFVVIEENYPCQLRGAFHKFLEDFRVNKKEEPAYETLCMMIDGRLDLSVDISKSNFWFSLEHPKAEVRRATLSSLAASGVLESITVDSQKLVVRDVILRLLYDEDLGVVQATLSLHGLHRIIDAPILFGAIHDVILRCVDTVMTSTPSTVTSQACDVAISCLDFVISNFHDQLDYSKGIATMTFPLLLVLQKTWKLNIKALQLAKEIRWPFYHNILGSYDLITVAEEQKLENSHLSSINVKTIETLAETFSTCPQGYMPWLMERSNDFELSKTLFLLVILQSFIIKSKALNCFLLLFRTCFPVLKNVWREFESCDDVFLKEEFNINKMDDGCSRFIEQLSSSNFKALNGKLLICIFWRLLEAFLSTASLNNMAENQELACGVDELFAFLAASPLKNGLREHLHLLLMKCNSSPVGFLCKFYTEEGFSVALQIESLLSYAKICSQSTFSENIIQSSDMQLLLNFPSVLVPICNEEQGIRVAAMKCIEAIHTLWRRISIFGGKNGSDSMFPHSTWMPFLGDFLGLLVQQQQLILSDQNFLPSFLTSILGPTCNSLLMPQNLHNRFDQHTKEAIFLYIVNAALKLSAFGKLKILSLLKELGSNVLHVEGVKCLLFELLERRSNYHLGLDRSCQALSKLETDILCFLLSFAAASSFVTEIPFDDLMKCLWVDGSSLEDPAIIQPCVTVLQNLNSSICNHMKTEAQDQLLQELVILFRNDTGAIQDAAKEALLRMHVTFSTIKRLLDLTLVQGDCLIDLSNDMIKKKVIKKPKHGLHHDLSHKEERRISFLSGLLDVLLLKKDIENRESLVGSLFNLLREVFSEKWLLGFVGEGEKWIEASFDVSQTLESMICYIQQTVILILENIIASVSCDTTCKDEILSNLEVKQLVDCARASKDATTRNHVFSLLSSIVKVVPEIVVDHIIDILTLIGESTAIQSDNHSKRVFEDLISTIVPCWLSKTNNADELVQIFINALPEVAEHRRLTIVVYLLRTLGEQSSLASLLVLLIRSLVWRKRKSYPDDDIFTAEILSSTLQHEWEYIFVKQVYEQYSCMIWLPSLVKLAQKVQMDNQFSDQIAELLIVMQFVLYKLKDTELVFKLESGGDRDHIQRTLGDLMEQVVWLSQLVNAKVKSLRVSSGFKGELREQIRMVIKTITKEMVPSAYFKGIILLLGHADESIRKQALLLLCETVKDHHMVKAKGKEKRNLKQTSDRSWHHLDETSQECFGEMCLKIVQLIDGYMGDSNPTVKLAAVSAIEVLANNFPSNSSIFMSCLTSVAKYIGSEDITLSSSCLRTTGALINVLGPRALSMLPSIMEQVLKCAHNVSSALGSNVKHSCEKPVTSFLSGKDSLLLSVLVTLEAVLDKLGSFLSPYLDDIMELLVLHPEYVSGLDPKMNMKAEIVRKLVTEKIPVRHTLTPLLKSYPKAVKSGESSLLIFFEMLASLIGRMDRSSIGSYHAKIFEHCLLALDLRHEHPASVKDVDTVEDSVISAMIILTMKLTEKLFKPLFIRSLEWAESELERSSSTEYSNVDRTISFYKLINKLVEHHRSLFVPYFKYLLEDCTCHLTDGPDAKSVGMVLQKRKKARTDVANIKNKGGITTLLPKQWHLRALIISSLHKCFVYDTGNQKFLDSSNFQVLLKPLVPQLVADPPTSIQGMEDVPSVKEVDDSLVSCLGQMAVTAGSDLLWKPLNHEVLMQTRSEKIRPRILGLRVIKYLVEHLKEEYMVFLPETIPFLAELLEDVELPVKSLAQEIIKGMETLSGESLRQYL